MTVEEEQALIRRVQSGDAAAFEPLLTAYEKGVYNLCLRMVKNPADAEDLAQESFLKAYRGLGAYRAESRFSLWLYRIASNLCLDFLRQQKRRPTAPLQTEDEDGEERETEIPDERYQPERLLEQKLTQESLRRGLDALPPEFRQVLLLRELQGLSYEEIGAVTGLESGTVKSRIFRARKKLCTYLQHDGNLPDWITSKEVKEVKGGGR